MPEYYDPAAEPSQPDTSSVDKMKEKSAFRRNLEPAWNAINPLPLAKMGLSAAKGEWSGLYNAVAHNENPFQSIKEGYEPAINAAAGAGGEEIFRRSAEQFKQGHPVEAITGAVGASPTGERIAEKYGTGDVAGTFGELEGLGLQSALMTELPGKAFKKVVVGPAQKFARGVVQADFLPGSWFKKLPEEQQTGLWNDVLQNKIKPDFKSEARAAENADKAVNQIKSTVEANKDVRLPMSKVDESVDVQTSPAHEFAPVAAQRTALEDVQGQVQGIKLGHAAPQELQAAKEAYRAEMAAKGVDVPSVISDTTIKAIKYPSTMTAGDFWNLKKEFRNYVTDPGGRIIIKDAQGSLINHVAGVANETLIDAFPELKQAGIQARDWINIEKLVHEATGRAMGRTKMGIGGAFVPYKLAGEGLKAIPEIGKAALISTIIRNPINRARFASLVYRSSGGAIGPAETLSRMSVVAEIADKQAANEQKQESAVQAGP